MDKVGSWFQVEFKDRLKHTNESLQEEWNREWDNIGIEIEKAARKEHIWVDFINTDSSVMGAFTATFEINNGDWKHDHLAFDEVVKEYFANNEKYALWKIDTNQTDSSDDDSYSAEHIAFIVPKDKMELLNSMKSLFAESVNPAELTDCPACGDTSFDSKRGRCTKCNYREELDESKSTKEAIATHIYLFSELTDEDIDMLKAYSLKFLGKNHGADGSEDNWVVSGTLTSLNRYANNWLGYELHPDYLYDADDFAGDIE